MTDSPGDLRDLRLKRTRDELHTGPIYQLRFDGKKLGLIENGAEIASWSAVSGKPGFQGQQHEILRDRGPLPRTTGLGLPPWRRPIPTDVEASRSTADRNQAPRDAST